MNTKINDKISWVGYVDWNVRDFHGYQTEHGATYNAYLIQDEKTVLVDTVKSHFASELIKNISELTPLDKVDYVICNHAEIDHSSSLPIIMQKLPNAVLVCNASCKKALSAYYDTSEWKWKIVENGEMLKIGEKTLHFIFTPMVHWPESMFTYVPEDKLLFSMDAFGQHLASSERFDDELQLNDILREAKTYYANIVMPYGNQVLKTLTAAANLEINTICTSHGVIWRKNLPAILNAYKRWASGEIEPKVLILYDSMWESTSRLAKAVYAGVLEIPGISAQLLHVRRTSLTEIATAAMDCGCCAVGSATLNTLQMPMISAAMTYLQGLRPPIKHTFAFGSYGWGKGAVEEISTWFEKVKWTPIQDPVKCIFRPDADSLEKCREAGRILAQKALEMTKN
ncbi:MAG: FprA family A-type flavoprotein [Planctomycetia bacterium]|nr:FprA family A-type flavoprotein [Planctomycetia bacterium]